MILKVKSPSGTNPTGLDSVHGAEPARRTTLSSIPRFALVNSNQWRFNDGNPNLKEAARIR